MTTNIPWEHQLTHEEYYRSMGVTCNCKKEKQMGHMTRANSDKLRAQLEAEAKAATPRKIFAIANDIINLWPKPYFGAVPYLKAMRDLDTINDTYGADSARSIIMYFLSNAKTFRGEDARRLKAELNALMKL